MIKIDNRVNNPVENPEIQRLTEQLRNSINTEILNKLENEPQYTCIFKGDTLNIENENSKNKQQIGIKEHTIISDFCNLFIQRFKPIIDNTDIEIIVSLEKRKEKQITPLEVYILEIVENNKINV